LQQLINQQKDSVSPSPHQLPPKAAHPISSKTRER